MNETIIVDCEGISLGWNCHSAGYGVKNGLRNLKMNGYKTCPFDEMITNYKGVIDCIRDDFQYLCDTKYLELIQIPKTINNSLNEGEFLIYNKKYKFIFNHESPGHANLYLTQKWKNGIDHFILNDYEEFKNRYNTRIRNMKELLNSGKHIHFILTRTNTKLDDIEELNDTIKYKYPHLKYNFTLLDFNKHALYKHLLLMKIDENDEEIKRLCIEP